MGQIIFLISVLFWFGVEIFVHFFFNKENTKKHEEKRSKYIMTSLFLFGMFGGYVLDTQAIDRFFEPFNFIQYIGIIIILIGVFIRVNTIRMLGNAFSVNIGVHKEQKLLKTGLFSVIRHPAYFGIFLAFIGISISFYNPITTSFGIVFPFLGLMYRIKVEERLLVKYFGDEYKQYQKETKKLIPFII